MRVMMLRSSVRSVIPVFWVLGLLVAGAACRSDPGPQVVSGTVALSTFPAPVELVHVVRGGRSVVGTRVAPDGAFSLTIPPGRGYRIEFVGASGRPVLVFPRREGAVDATFDVRGGVAPFDLGVVRHVGDPQARTFAFLSTIDGTGDPDAVECEDGIDPATGAVCVDDDDEDGAGECDEEDDDVEVECEDGVDLATGAPCVDDDAGEVPGEAAVADHNLPPAIGCAQDEEDEDQDEEDED